MLNIAFYAVVGGALAGLACGGVLSRRSLWSYTTAGALGGTVGLVLYALLRATLGRPILFLWQGIWWALIGVMFAVMTVTLLVDDHR